MSAVINRNSFAFAFDHGQVLFRAFDTSTPSANEALYLAKLSDGSITKVIAVGDTLDGRQVTELGNPGPGALSGGNLVFTAKLSDLSYGLFAATQTCGADVSANVRVKRSGFRLNRATGRYVQTVTLTNIGANPVSTPISLVLRNLAAATPLVNKTGTTTCLAPTGAVYKSVTVSGNALAAGASVTEQLEFTRSGNQPILYTPQVSAASGP